MRKHHETDERRGCLYDRRSYRLIGIPSKIRSSGCHIRVYPAWRPDKVLAIDNFKALNDYLSKLEEAADKTILTYKHLLEALQKRHDFFAAQGCRLSDHGLDTFYAEPYTEQEIEVIFLKARMGKSLTEQEVRKYRSALLYELAVMDAGVDGYNNSISALTEIITNGCSSY